MKYQDKDVTPQDYDAYWKKVGVFADERVEEILFLCPPGLKTVDLGGGSGALAQRLGALVVDWSTEAIKQAKKLGVKTIKSHLLPFLEKSEEKYELVILADVLEEMRRDETGPLLRGIRKICSKYFVISTPTHENYLNISTHQVIYSKEELEEMLANLGFKKELEIEYTDRLIARYSL